LLSLGGAPGQCAHRFDAVIHFAGYKAVGESVAKPLEYYYNNFQGTVTLLRAMREQGLKNVSTVWLWEGKLDSWWTHEVAP